MKCYNHENIDAVGICISCGIGVCKSCSLLFEEKLLCMKCYEKINKTKTISYDGNASANIKKLIDNFDYYLELSEKAIGLDASEGKAIIPLLEGSKCDIVYDPNSKGLISSKIPPKDQLTWEAFNASVELVIKNGGKAKKGNARSGAILGSTGLPINSIEGYIAHKVHGVKEGETAFGPGFVIAAVLDWAEICINNRGYLTINSNFLKEFKNFRINS